MKPIFAKIPSLGVRLFFTTILSISLIVLDGRSSAIVQIRNVLETAVATLYYLANTPHQVLNGMSSNFIDGQKLQIENAALKAQLRDKNADLLLLEQLKVENHRLRLLLSSPLRQDEFKKVAEVLAAEIDTYRQQVVVNQGRADGAFVGQPVIDEKGVVGQVISVGEKSSRILLLTDVTHAIPVQVLRNDVRAIASGTGQHGELILDNLPRTVDIVKGDLLVTSGLGGRFPEGYPVAVVEKVLNDGSKHFAQVTARPLASLDRLRYLLLLWGSGEEMRKIQGISPQDVRDAVEERRKSLNPLDRLQQNHKTQVLDDVPQEPIDESEVPTSIPDIENLSPTNMEHMEQSEPSEQGEEE